MDKQAIRKEVTEKKKSMSMEEAARLSLDLKEKFCALDEYKEASVIYAYMAFNREVRTKPVIEQAWKDNKRVAVPRVFNKEYMEFIYIDSFDELEEGYMGIQEPKREIFTNDFMRFAEEDEALILVPGLAFGRDGNRIGYGGGFYDSYFADYEDLRFIKAALCFDFQLYPRLEAKEHDVKMDIIISNSAALRICG